MDDLKAFLLHLLPLLKNLPGTSTRVIVGWEEAEESSGSSGGGGGTIEDVVAEVLKGSSSGSGGGSNVEVEVVKTIEGGGGGRSFSPLIGALSRADASDVVVVVGPYTRLTRSFFLTIKSIIHHQTSIYFPLYFRRHDPQVMEEKRRRMVQVRRREGGELY